MANEIESGFEWDADKAEGNKRKHGVTFDEAATVCLNQLSLTIPDHGHSTDEERFLILGLSNRRRLLVVSHVARGNNIRGISARVATKRERRDYDEGT